MKDLTEIINDAFMPVKALLVFHSKEGNDYYVESHDLDNFGNPINAHPLTLDEGNAMAKALNSIPNQRQGFLKSKGLMPDNLLYLNTDADGFAIWYTKTMKANLFFTDDLTIPNGQAFVPPLLWKASKSNIEVWALPNNRKPTLSTVMCKAPFFNVRTGGSVCMGNVVIKIDVKDGLEVFMANWQTYFFNSKFTHLLAGESPVHMNIVQLWQDLVGTDSPFPLMTLKKTKTTLKSLIQ